MSQSQLGLVADTISVYKRIRSDLPTALPFWPLGLPKWTDSWFALGMRCPASSYVLVWHRGLIGEPQGVDGSEHQPRMTLPVPHLRDTCSVSEVLYPALGLTEVAWEDGRGDLIVDAAHVPSACLIELHQR